MASTGNHRSAPYAPGPVHGAAQGAGNAGPVMMQGMHQGYGMQMQQGYGMQLQQQYHAPVQPGPVVPRPVPQVALRKEHKIPDSFTQSQDFIDENWKWGMQFPRKVTSTLLTQKTSKSFLPFVPPRPLFLLPFSFPCSSLPSWAPLLSFCLFLFRLPSVASLFSLFRGLICLESENTPSKKSALCYK